ncbi:hypothetical protein R3P38DRAFT_2799725 [Favolaschia claudopus]|uniref:Ubiquitin-like protease family profile domain-containing protein n=1 Tax=Favolaschia claudopus TaxID=2862362 RepID=A0AAV9ZZE2_9AGAR
MGTMQYGPAAAARPRCTLNPMSPPATAGYIGLKLLQSEAQSVDPFRRLLTQAVQWSSNLRVCIEQKVDKALKEAALLLRQQVVASQSTPVASVASDPASVAPNPASVASDPAPVASDPTTVASAETSSSNLGDRADRILCERCPACFNLASWGRPLADGGDVQLGGDGCNSYRRLASAGDGPNSYKAKYFLPKSTVDAAARQLKLARKSPLKNPKRSVPQEVIEMCEESWDAANEKKGRANAERYDASGVFVLTCRHGQVIFMCNIDTPGEQQCYIFAMLQEVIKMLPANATLVQFYDVGCIADHSLNLYPILAPSVRDRVTFAINGMHAYGHQWACQLVYSPRLRLGMGLSDHEGVERFWSRIRKLIPLTRTQWSSRRIWMIDQYADFVGKEGRAMLGGWINRQQHKNLTSKYRAASKVVDDCRVTDAELRAQWAAQKEAQTSIRAHAPARLRRELDKVLSLQTQIDAVEKAIEDTKATLKSSGASQNSLKILQGLEVTHDRLSEEAEALYSSLNIQKSFPELCNLPLEFAQTLLIMHDLKINIRKCATGSFMEWETLDRAVSGRREALGTKLHQSTRKAITKRQPALLKAITKFNAGCATLERLSPPRSSIPVPSPLSTQLNVLRNGPSLHEDVWITPSDGPIPRWLNDEDVKDGIRSLHVLDRCAEEIIRLNLERDNLRRWLAEEKEIVQRSIELIADSSENWLSFFVLQRETELANLEQLWTPFLQHRDINNRLIRNSATSMRASAASVGGSVAGVTLVTASVSPSVSPSITTSIAPRITEQPNREHPSAEYDDDPFTLTPTPRRRQIAQVSVVVDDDELFEDNKNDEPASGDTFVPDTGDASDEDEVQLIEEVFENLDDEGEVEIETSNVEAADILNVQWEFKSPDRIDTTFATDLSARNHNLRLGATPGNFTHYVVRPNRRPLQILASDFYPFSLPTGRLTGFGLNSVATSLLNVFRGPYSPFKASADQCALFSTYDLPRVHFKRSDPDIWRHISPTEYWDKPLWLIPIHRKSQEHWVLIVVDIPARELLFFDSLASSGGWRQDLRVRIFLFPVSLMRRGRADIDVITGRVGECGRSSVIEQFALPNPVRSNSDGGSFYLRNAKPSVRCNRLGDIADVTNLEMQADKDAARDDVMLLITRLVVLANRNNHPLHVSPEDPDENWSARFNISLGRAATAQ